MVSTQIERAIIVHGYLGNSGKHWFPELIDDLVKIGIDARATDLPSPEQPDLERWVEHLSLTIGQPDEGLLVVTHSLGGLAVAAYLGGLDYAFTLGGLLAVAPFYNPLPILPELDHFVAAVSAPEEKLATIGRSTLSRRVIRSDNDPYVPRGHSERYAQQLGASTVVDASAEHFFDRRYPSIATTAGELTQLGQSHAGRST
ncbi:RBBP9/YdeN family alpha/beta hydrolase [Tsukamurella sp. USMM236]|uniref:RBBP9/YdeN family alpha/beta hydrolase n=1 Tax=Tsukamurella sp. USMM236 TaxID=3081301 RepID=UPI0030193924